MNPMGGLGFFENHDPTDLSTRCVDAVRPIKVIVVGAGMSGIIAGIFFPRSIENLDLVIYEKVSLRSEASYLIVRAC